MNLTSAQKLIVEHLADGETCDQIAEEFNRSVHTVRTHVKQACERVEAKNIPNLVAISISRGFIKTLACAVLSLVIGFGADDQMRRTRAVYRIAVRQEVVIYA